ncbi:MAG: UDP-N-acetylmuramate--L-alanine ligase [Candidatus Sumerlaeaceae bacterium]|nr:UDP-N-acetylmuramate--L-alanine ligase [Candidatus Sumerlaeaceae bacterium]
MADSRIHFVGIGGIGMSGIARMLLHKGMHISGSDSKESEIVRELRARGAEIQIGHRSENVHGAAEVVTSSAISKDNPEWSEAIRLGIPVMHRSKKLAQLVNAHRGITIAGTHGKTTTTSMVATVLHSAGLVPSYVVGGIINTFSDNARMGDGDWFVIEADESDGSLVEYRPEIAILTNIELDHTDYYRDLAHLHEVFGNYISNIRPGGICIYCADDEGARTLVSGRNGCEYLSYGLKPGARLVAGEITFSDLGSRFPVLLEGKELGLINLQVPGLHNCQNCLAAVAVGLRAGLDFQTIATGLNHFNGVQRRFQIIARNGNSMVVDDYAHHPSEVRATLSAARRAHKSRIIAAFQPHRYSRTQSFAQDFGAAFGNADEVIITDIYGAGEEPIPEVTSELIIQSLKANNHPNVRMVHGLDNLESFLAGRMRPDDMVITLGAGDIWKVAKSLGERIPV